jgi:NADH dehydrogenase
MRTKPTTTAQKTQIVVVGGGAGGLELVRRLGARFGRRRHDIILLERNRTHIWKPLLHEVAAGSLDANLDEVGYRGHCHRWGYRFFWGSMEGVDRDARQVIVAPLIDEDGSELIGRHTIRYDYLVLAIGSVTNDFGITGVKDHCLFLDDRTQADRFRNKLLNHCLRVSRAMSRDGLSDQYVRVAVVGAGATGVELAAELFNAAQALRHYGLEVFDETRLKVTIIEAGPRILPVLPEALADAARAQLEALGVTVLVGRRVVEVTADAVITAQGDTIQAEIKVWAAGVRGPDVLTNIAGLERTPTNQLQVRPSLQTTVDERIFAMGDCCACLDPRSGRPVPPRAQAAHQMASTTFENLRRSMDGRDLIPMVYQDHGSLVSLSRFSTVGSLMGALVGGRMAVYGAIARLVYQSLYRMHLVAIHGWLKGLILIFVGYVNAVVRPKLKFH